MSDTTIAKPAFETMKVGELRMWMREQYATKQMWAGVDSRAFSQFVNFGTKDGLVRACHTNSITQADLAAAPIPPQHQPQTAAAQQSAPAADGAAEQQAEPAAEEDDSPMAFIKAAIDKAVARERQKLITAHGIELAQVKVELEKTLKAAKAMGEARKQMVDGIMANNNAQTALTNGAAAPDIDVSKMTGSDVLRVIRPNSSVVRLPKEDKFYIIDPNHMSILDDSLQRGIERGVPSGVLMVGPKGCGKSTLPEQWSFRQGRPFHKVNAALLREAKEWFGTKSVLNGSLFFIMSQFASALETPNVTILIDEINRAIAQALNSLLGILDSGHCYVEELGREVEIAKGVMVCASMNEGSEYTVHELDSALKDRFPVRLECSYLKEAEEIQVLMNKATVPESLAKKVVLLANTIRDKYVDASGIGGTLHETMSTRQLIEVAWFLKKQGKDSLAFTVTNRFSGVGGRESEQCQVANIIQGIFG